MQNLQPTMPQSEPNAPWRPPHGPLSLLGIVAPCYVVIDLLTVTLIEGSNTVSMVALIIGVVLAQFGVLAVWAALGPGPWYVRQPAAIFGALVSLGALFSGARPNVTREFFLDALWLPFIFLCVQAPLWLFRLVRGWRIAPIGGLGVNAIADVRRFSLGQLFAATTMVATAMALARAGQDVQDMLPVAIGAAVFGLLAVTPCVWSALGARSAAVGTYLVLAYAVAGVMAFVIILASFAGTPDGNTFISLEAFSVSIIGTMHGLLVLARKGGVVLQCASKRPRSHSQRATG